MYATQVKEAPGWMDSYPEVAKIINDNKNVIITDNGKKKAVIMPFDNFKSYEDLMYANYVNEKLAEAEADDPDDWITFEEMEEEWDRWEKENL